VEQVRPDAEIPISMDGKGRWRDSHNRATVALPQYECIYLYAFETGTEVRQGLKRWIEFYNTWRPRSKLDDSIPEEAYWLIQGLATPASLSYWGHATRFHLISADNPSY